MASAGFPWVDEIDGESNYVRHYFYTTSNTSESVEKLTGREYRTEWYSSGGSLLRRVDFTWNWTYTVKGNYLERQWGGPGSGNGNGEFYDPWQVTVGPDGYVYVADAVNARVQKFTPAR